MYPFMHVEVAICVGADGHKLVVKDTDSEIKHGGFVEDGPAQSKGSAYDKSQGRGEVSEQLHPYSTDQSRLLSKRTGRHIHQMIVHTNQLTNIIYLIPFNLDSILIGLITNQSTMIIADN